MLGDNLYLENIQEYVQDEDKIVRMQFENLSSRLHGLLNSFFCSLQS